MLPKSGSLEEFGSARSQARAHSQTASGAADGEAADPRRSLRSDSTIQPLPPSLPPSAPSMGSVSARFFRRLRRPHSVKIHPVIIVGRISASFHFSSVAFYFLVCFDPLRLAGEEVLDSRVQELE